MSWMESLLLGLLQGLTEFLPVSSSGHLVLARSFLSHNLRGGAAFEVALHLATVLAILTVYRRDVARMAGGVPALLVPRRWGRAWEEQRAFRMLVLLLVSAVPTGMAGFMLREPLEGLFRQPRVVGAALILTGCLLVATRHVARGGRDVGLGTSLGMGMAQAVALVPGVSRSGVVISAGLAAGSERTEVGRFAFLMALPPILGAAALEVPHIRELGSPWMVLSGSVAAYISGLAALKLLLRFVAGGRLFVFGPYCLAAGLLALVLAP